MIREKRCHTCGETKGIEHYNRSRYTKDGYAATCKECFEATKKRCPSCCRLLPRSKFGRNLNRYDGLEAYCKLCQHDLEVISNAKRKGRE